MRKLFRCCAVACAVLGAPGLATAQNPTSYPDRPIRLVVAFVAGGATDTLARQISNDLKEALGQTHRRREPAGSERLHGLELTSRRRNRTATRCCWRKTRSPSARRSTRKRPRASIP